MSAVAALQSHILASEIPVPCDTLHITGATAADVTD